MPPYDDSLLVRAIDSILFGPSEGAPADVKKDLRRLWQLRLLLFTILALSLLLGPIMAVVSVLQEDVFASFFIVVSCSGHLLAAALMRVLLVHRKWRPDLVLSVITLLVILIVLTASLIMAAFGEELGFQGLAIGPGILLALFGVLTSGDWKVGFLVAMCYSLQLAFGYVYLRVPLSLEKQDMVDVYTLVMQSSYPFVLVLASRYIKMFLEL